MSNCLGKAFQVFLILCFSSVGIVSGVFLIRSGANTGELVASYTGIALVAIACMGGLGWLFSKIKQVSPWIRLGLAVMVSAGVVFGINHFSTHDIRMARPEEAILAALAPVCQGQGTPGAGAYSPGSGQTAHLVILDASGQPHEWTGLGDLDWRPNTLAEVELVACVGKPTIEHVRTCHYTRGGQLILKTEKLTVKVYAAQTGALISTSDFEGTTGGCPTTKQSSEKAHTEQVHSSMVMDWFRDIIQ